MQFIHTDIREIVQEVYDKLTPLAKNKDISLSLNQPDTEVILPVERDTLTEAVYNIADNSIKYTEPGGSIEVIAEKNDSAVIISVSDTGAGIAPEDLSKVKQKFYKANKTKHGSGIGLAVADEIITMHGGLLDIESELGKGTKVTITLPLKNG